MISKIVLKIKGMHCSSCAMNIDGELEDLGVKSSSTDYRKTETVVEYDTDKISIAAIKEVIKNLGYESSV